MVDRILNWQEAQNELDNDRKKRALWDALQTVVEVVDGVKFYRVNGELHRNGGPAVESKYGNQYWYQYGKLHREDGPAVLVNYDELTGDYLGKYWYLEDVDYYEEFFNKVVKRRYE